MSVSHNLSISLEESLLRIIEARHHNPFEVLGSHVLDGERVVVLAFLPQAELAYINDADLTLARIPDTDLFVGETAVTTKVPIHYRLCWLDKAGHEHLDYDPYTFAPTISELDLHLHSEGRHWHAYQMLGAHCIEIDGIAGVRFAVWAPTATRVSVVGEFNGWDGRVHPLRVRGGWGYGSCSFQN